MNGVSLLVVAFNYGNPFIHGESVEYEVEYDGIEDGIDMWTR